MPLFCCIIIHHINKQIPQIGYFILVTGMQWMVLAGNPWHTWMPNVPQQHNISLIDMLCFEFVQAWICYVALSWISCHGSILSMEHCTINDNNDDNSCMTIPLVSQELNHLPIVQALKNTIHPPFQQSKDGRNTIWMQAMQTCWQDFCSTVGQNHSGPKVWKWLIWSSHTCFRLVAACYSCSSSLLCPLQAQL